MSAITFQVDVSRTYRNKEGYKVGPGRLNTSFKTEPHTPESFLDSVIRQGWPYTMVHLKRSPQETGAAARNVKTPKHTENFISRQDLTGDIDNKQARPGVIAQWLHDSFFRQYGWAFVESVNSIPGQVEKGHPTLIFDRPITCAKLWKECMQAWIWKYPDLDRTVAHADLTVYNAQNARVHLLGNICPFEVFEREILEPYREHLAEQAAIEAEYQRQRQAEREKAKGKAKQDAGALEDYLTRTLDGIFDFVANQRDNRHGGILWAGKKVGGLEAAEWSQPFSHLFDDVENRITLASESNGYMTHPNGGKAEILRTFADGQARAEVAPEPYARRVRPKGPGPKELERRAVRLARSADPTPPQLTPLEFENPLEPAELDKCEITSEHPVWTSEGGKGKTFFYCNDPARCAMCRERHAIKLRFYLEEIARLAYVDENGKAAYSPPKLNEAGGFFSASVGNGIWYGKILRWGERHAWRTRYKRHRPGGFISPEVYPIQDGGDKFIALSLAPFEDMQPVTLTDDLLQRIVIGVPHTRASLLFAPARKQLELALPRYSFEIPQYLNDRGIVATIPAAHSVLFIGPVKPEDIYCGFNTKAETFDDIGLILEEVALKSIDNDRLRGVNDHAPDYVIQSIHIVPKAKPAYLAVYNAGREGDIATIKKFKRADLPKLPTLQSGCVDKGIYTKFYIPLSTHGPVQDNELTSESPFYYAKLEHLLETGAI